jgi:hypothetical protein
MEALMGAYLRRVESPVVEIVLYTISVTGQLVSISVGRRFWGR